MRKELALAAVSALLALGILELGLRLFSEEELLEPPAVYRFGILYTRPPYSSFPHKSRDFDVVYTTNRHGFRGRDHDFRKGKGVCRIVALGDSFTWGTGVADDRTYCSVLEDDLGRWSRSTRYEVVNLGLMALGLVENEYVYRKMGVLFQPDLVVLSFIGNDLEYEILARKDAPEAVNKAASLTLRIRALARDIPGYTALCTRSHLLAWARRNLSRLIVARRDKGMEAGLAALDEAGRLERMESRGIENADRLVDEVCGSGRRLLILDAGDHLRRYKRLHRHLEGRAASGTCPELVRVETGPEHILSKRDWHWNEKGHALVAEMLFRSVVKGGGGRSRRHLASLKKSP
jgi:hypothetical protein